MQIEKRIKSLLIEMNQKSNLSISLEKQKGIPQRKTLKMYRKELLIMMTIWKWKIGVTLGEIQ